MTAEIENYILSGVFFLILCLIFYFWKFRKKKKMVDATQRFVLDTLELARSQFEIFNLKLHGSPAAKNGLSAMLHEIGQSGLRMDVGDFVADDWKNMEVDVFFRVRREEGPVFYVFNSVIKQIDSEYENSHILVAMPEHLRVEKKRHFIRVKPQKSDVRVIGVWPVRPGEHLPRSTSDIGTPLTHYKPGMSHEPVHVENISASGLALRFALDENGKPEVEFEKGSQILCLVVYVMEGREEKPVAFWCTGEVMNSRIADGPHPALVLGLEFTNWAVLEQGTTEIHWAHSSPSRGVRPILQWVEQIDRSQRKPA